MRRVDWRGRSFDALRACHTRDPDLRDRVARAVSVLARRGGLRNGRYAGVLKVPPLGSVAILARVDDETFRVDGLGLVEHFDAAMPGPWPG